MVVRHMALEAVVEHSMMVDRLGSKLLGILLGMVVEL